MRFIDLPPGAAGAALLLNLILACSLANAPAEPVPRGGSGAASATPACPAGAKACGAACVDLQNNKLHCGKCDNACKDPADCVGGNCEIVCGGGSKRCGDKCADVKTDPANCGDCGKACPAPAGAQGICAASTCAVACKPPFRDCNANPADGCETDTSQSKTDCGACAIPCPLVAPNAAPQCVMGVCKPNCTPTFFDDCDGSVVNGCETDLRSDAKNCGMCNKACNTTLNEACQNGTCKVQPFNWTILEQKDIFYNGVSYSLLKLKYISDQAYSQNWCQDYANLCTSFGYKPTGCDGPMYGGSYLYCTNNYQSIGTGNSLGCNPSSGVMNAAKQAGYTDATTQNSFGFFVCDAASMCNKTMCSAPSCSSSLSYFHYGQPHGYTLCRK